VGDDAVKLGRIGVSMVEMRRVHIPRYIGEQFNIVLGERAHDLRCVPDRQLVECVVFDDVRGQ
jgi:hypothetical protein